MASRPPTAPSSVHPRSRGEHGLALLGMEVVHRFIPAHAGNTLLCNSETVHSSVHPRSRGEHSDAVEVMYTQVGSSPLTRGTHMVTLAAFAIARFIPAHAGNTTARCSSIATATVHPRSRGEHSYRHVCCCRGSGSSPLTRGTPVFDGRGWPAFRFIPAHAGNTAKVTPYDP